MRREARKRKNEDEMNMKIIKYTGIGVAILAVILIILLVYSRNLNKEVREGTLTSEQISNILNKTNSVENTESASTEIGKSINEVTEELNIINENTTNTLNNSEKNEVLTTNKVTSASQNTTISTNTNNVKDNEESKEDTAEKEVELNFEKPVEGDIVRDFAVDSLIYSETLQEWTTHPGIDIKADKTTVVKASEEGIVKTIKNDPRYGLTVIIEHANGFQTVYSNLLTSEFVVEGEEIKKGQSIGTIGNVAAFEIVDEPHLHFEILKDNVAVDPSIYLK